MLNIKVHLKILTPTFIGEWDNICLAGFRVPTLKGLLRYWWRAFCSNNYNDYSKLLEEEGKIWGSQSQKSNILIIVIESNEIKTKSIKDYLEDLKNQFKKDLNGVRYLYFSMFPMGTFSGRQYFIEPNSNYELLVCSKEENYLIEFLKALWALENFGGIGARSRRGAGSFYVEKIEGLESIKDNERPKFLFEYKNDKTFNINKFIESNLKFYTKSNSLPEFTRISNDYFDYKIIDHNFTNWYLALNYIGEKLKNFRSYTNSPFNKEASFIKNYLTKGAYNGPKILTKTSFGLPIIYRFKSIKGSIEVKPKNKDYTRRASPLFIKIGKYPNQERYYILVSIIWSRFLPDDEKLILKEVELNQPDINTLKDFLNSL